MTTWEETALIWERRATALRGIADLLLDSFSYAASTSTDPAGCLSRFERVHGAFQAMMARPDLAGGVAGGDEFRARVEAGRRRGFDSIRRVLEDGLRAAGKAPDPGVVLGEGPGAPELALPRFPDFDEERARQLAELLLDVFGETEDADARDLLLRALAVYRSFVRHARAGGRVKFVKDGSPDRTLRVRLR